jgi:rRNA maturation endonuclease Nob1
MGKSFDAFKEAEFCPSCGEKVCNWRCFWKFPF